MNGKITLKQKLQIVAVTMVWIFLMAFYILATSLGSRGLKSEQE